MKLRVSLNISNTRLNQYIYIVTFLIRVGIGRPYGRLAASSGKFSLPLGLISTQNICVTNPWGSLSSNNIYLNMN